MEFGNKYLGGDLNKDYLSIFVFPLGLEFFAYNEDLEINFTIWPIQFTFGIGRNRSLFKG